MLEQNDTADKVLEEDSVIQLTGEGLERVYSCKENWKLKVQDVLLTIATPTIMVRETLIKAGIDPKGGWWVALKIKGAPREAVGMDGIIDLTRKGIEKLWQRPNHIQNGDLSQIFVKSCQ